MSNASRISNFMVDIIKAIDADKADTKKTLRALAKAVQILAADMDAPKTYGPTKGYSPQDYDMPDFMQDLFKGKG